MFYLTMFVVMHPGGHLLALQCGTHALYLSTSMLRKGSFRTSLRSTTTCFSCRIQIPFSCKRRASTTGLPWEESLAQSSSHDREMLRDNGGFNVLGITPGGPLKVLQCGVDAAYLFTSMHREM